MVEHKKVALRFSLNSGFTRQIVQGIISYTRKHGPWEIDIRSEEPISFSSWADLKKWTGDGIIAPAYRKEHVNMLAKKEIPVVTTSRVAEGTAFPSVTFDDIAIGKMAAEHLLEHNLDHFAFIGPKEWDYSQRRCKGFADTLAEHGSQCTKCWIRPATNTRQLDESWIENSYYLEAIKQLAPPIGVFASNDRVGYGILRACKHLGLRVPEDVCLISVDNDEILCNLASPNLSSIALSGEEFGYQAAKMLSALMNGKEPKVRHVIIPPKSVVMRNSSDFLKVEDPYVADAPALYPQPCRSIHRRLRRHEHHGCFPPFAGAPLSGHCRPGRLQGNQPLPCRTGERTSGTDRLAGFPHRPRIRFQQHQPLRRHLP